MSDGELDWCSVSSNEDVLLGCCVKEGAEAKFPIYQSIYVPPLTYGHEVWVMTKRMISWPSGQNEFSHCDRVQPSRGDEVQPLRGFLGLSNWEGLEPQLTGETYRSAPWDSTEGT